MTIQSVLKRWLLATLAVFSLVQAVPAQDTPLPVDPFSDLVDLSRLTYPITGSNGQGSSYDRSGGNGDASFWYYHRAEPKRVVMTDVCGPGCISRIWVTAFDWNTARIEIFIDGSATPAVSAWMRDFFGSGTLPPFVPPRSMHTTGSWASYVPIPFSKSCRIEAINARTDNNVIYYNVSYRTYLPGEPLADAFQMPPSTAQQAKLDQFTAQWNNRGQDPKGTQPGQQTVTGAPSIPVGGTATLANLSGAGEVTGIQLAISPNAWDPLRWARIRCRFDGSASYAVDSPIGAFFGCGFPPANVTALPLGMNNGQMYMYFSMPYSNGAVIDIVNSSSTPISSASYTITYVPKQSTEIGRYRLHAEGRSRTPCGSGSASYRILDATGKGHYLGCVLSIESLGTNWGVLEGDEYIYVDGESTPRIHGTGTEDYFDGGYYFNDGPGSWPFAGCSVISQQWPLIMSAYRLSVPDAVVFRDGIIVDIEHGGVNEGEGNYYSTAFFYRDDGPGTPPADPVNPVLADGTLVNGDFEGGFGGYNNGEANGWVAYQPRSVYGLLGGDLNTFSAATDHKFSGSTSQKIFMRNPSVPNLSTGIAQQVQVERGVAYQVTARFRLYLGPGLGPGNTVPRLGLGVLGTTYHEDAGITWTEAPTAVDTWHTVTAVVEAETDFLTIFAEAQRRQTWPAGDATLWIDAVSIQRYTGAPLPPTDLSAAPGNAQVTLSWTASAGATSYNVKRATTSGGPYTPVATGVTTTTHTDTGLTNGTPYYYVVSAVNGYGESGNSSEVFATPSSVTAAEDFETMPSWSSSFDASWGGAASWSIVVGGQSGNALQVSRSNNGSSAKAKVYNIAPNTNYTISVFIKCPSDSGAYWSECAYKLGSFTAQDFDQNSATWTIIQKFDSSNNGNGNTWTQYSKTLNSGSYTQISIGYKLGLSSGTAPVVLYDTLRVVGSSTLPAINRSPTTLSPSCTQGSNAASQTFTVSNSGGGTLSYSISDNVSWLSCSPTSGTSTGEADTITVTYSTSSLSAGTYNGTITISDPNASNNPQTIAVTLTVSPPPPTITRSPSTLSPSCNQGSNAASQNFTVQNTGGGTLSYAISDNVTWLSCSPTSGTSTGEADTITVTYSTSGLSAGTYNGTITISDPNATNNPQTVAVTLTVNSSKLTVAENFTSMPSWSSSYNAGWGSAASWSIVSGGQSGNALQASRGSQGSSAKVKVYNLTAGSAYTISVYIKCPSYGGTYWAECAYKLGSYTASDFDNNSGTWSMIKKFANDGTNGNGNTWTQYSTTFNSGTNTQISVGFKLGSYGGAGPTVQWDTLRVQ